MTTIFKALFLVSNTSLRNAESGNRTAYPLSDLRLVPEGQQVDVGLQRAGVDHRLVPETHDIVRRHLRLLSTSVTRTHGHLSRRTIHCD